MTTCDCKAATKLPCQRYRDFTPARSAMARCFECGHGLACHVKMKLDAEKQIHKDGINCPGCGGRLAHTVESRPNGKVRRRRYQCDECPTRFTTAEIPWRKHSELVKIEKKLKGIYKAIGQALDG